MPAADLGLFGVRIRGGALQADPFDGTALSARIRQVLLGRKGPFTESALDVITQRAVLRLERDLSQIRLPLTPDEFERNPEIVGAITDDAISAAVRAELATSNERPYRMGLLLWVMATDGSNEDGGGWDDAADVLDWLSTDMRLRVRYPDGPIVRTNTAVAASGPVLRPPEQVIKRHHEPSPFEMRQLTDNLRRALVGRVDADAKAAAVAHEIVAGVQGQRTVLSAQLSMAALGALRSVDDIGYLRWSVIAKGISSVRQLGAEAVDLVVAPSPRLALPRASVHG